jgi:hypothetical protein
LESGLPIFSQSSTSSDLLDRRRSPVAYRTVTFCGRPFQSVWLRSRRRMARGHGLVRVRSPLLTESRLMSFPPGTEMYQFPGFAPDGLCIQPPVAPSGCPAAPGCPIRKSPDQSLVGGSPELIAAFNVLHRLCTPRHPPYTLSSLTTLMNSCVKPYLSFREQVRRLSLAEHATKLDSESNGLDTCVSTYELVKDRHPLPAFSRPAHAARLTPIADACIRRPPGTRRCPEAHAPTPSLEPTGLEPATSALQTRRSPS